VRRPATSELLSVWERGADGGAAAAALALLDTTGAAGEGPAAGLAVGRRDGALMGVRRALFGDALDAIADCPACGDALEFACDVREMVVAGGLVPEAVDPLVLDGWTVEFRLPDGADALAAARTGDADAARRVLVARCVTAARLAGDAVPAAELPDEVVAAIGERMVAADPQADVEVELACPACGARWVAPFDIAGYLWDELDAWAARAFADIDTLARAYGWTEEEILALGDRRREAYLGLVGA
jgi:hypothetical protein